MSRKDSTGKVLKQGESQRNNGTYQYRYREDYTGNYKYLYAKTIDELREKEKSVLKTALCGYTTNSLTLDDLWRRYHHNQYGLIKQTTYQSYELRYNNKIKDAIGHYKITEINYSLILNFYKKLVLEDNLCYGSIKILHNILNGIFKTALRDKLIVANPLTDVLKEIKKLCENQMNYQRVIYEEERDKRLTSLQIEGLLEYLDKPYFEMQRHRILTLLYTGMRISELCGLLWEDVDFDENVINIRHNLVYHLVDGKYQMIMQSPKSKTSIRQIPMLSVVREILLKEKQKQKVIVSYDGCFGFVFTTMQNQPLKKNSFEKSLTNISQTYNKKQIDSRMVIEKLTPHILRHTFCSMLYESGVDVKVIQSIMGHTSFELTLQRYTHLSQETIIKEIKKIKII